MKKSMIILLSVFLMFLSLPVYAISWTDKSVKNIETKDEFYSEKIIKLE